MMSLRFLPNFVRCSGSLVPNQLGSIADRARSGEPSPPYQAKNLTTSTLFVSYAKIKDAPEVSLPLKPKRPLTPYLSFQKEAIEERGEKVSDLIKLSRQLSEEWRHMDKTKYKENYDRQVEDYKRQLGVYEESLTDEQRAHLRSLSQAKREKKNKRKLNKTQIPLGPRAPNQFYLMDRVDNDPSLREAMKTDGIGSVVRRVNQDYNALTDVEKMRYVAKADADKERFRRESTDWYERTRASESLPPRVRAMVEKLHQRHTAFY